MHSESVSQKGREVGIERGRDGEGERVEREREWREWKERDS